MVIFGRPVQPSSFYFFGRPDSAVRIRPSGLNLFKRAGGQMVCYTGHYLKNRTIKVQYSDADFQSHDIIRQSSVKIAFGNFTHHLIFRFLSEVI